MVQEIFDLFRNQEILPFIILAFLFVGIVVIFERLFVLQFLYRINFKKFNSSMKKMLAAGDLERARAFCIASSKTGLPLIAAKAIDTYQSEPFKVRLIVSENLLLFMPNIRRRISQIPNLATASILLGALSAVYGVWNSFHTADILDLGVKSFAFTQGMSYALTPLAFSIAVAVLMLVPYSFLESMASRLEGDIEHSLTVLLNILAPETQAMFSAPTGVAAGHQNANSSNKDSDELGMSGPAVDDDDLSDSSDGDDDEGSMEDTEIVPDEEEII